jgi:hypothetical protein
VREGEHTHTHTTRRERERESRKKFGSSQVFFLASLLNLPYTEVLATRRKTPCCPKKKSDKVLLLLLSASIYVYIWHFVYEYEKNLYFLISWS